MASHLASAVSMVCLISVHLLIFCIIGISRIPKDTAIVFYSITFDRVMLLALNVMAISLAESVLNSIVTLAAYVVDKKMSVADKVLVAYYTKAAKDVDEEARGRETIMKSQLELYAKMTESMQTVIDAVVEKKAVSVEEIKSTEEKEVHQSLDGSSTVSAASTD